MNKKISTILGIAVVLVLAIFLVGIIFWQYHLLDEKKIDVLIEAEHKDKTDFIEDETLDWRQVEIENDGFIFKIAISPCEYVDGWCYVKRNIKIMNADDNKVIKEIKAEPASSLGNEPRDDHHLLFDDLNFDGHDDLIIWNETSGAYGLGFYHVYLYDADIENFVFSKDFSGLVSGYYPDIDRKRQEIITFMKSGCCTHRETTYKVFDNKPVKIHEITIESGEITEGKLIDGVWVEALKVPEKRYRSSSLSFEMYYSKYLQPSTESVVSTGRFVNFEKDDEVVLTVRVGVRYSQELMRNYTMEEWIDMLPHTEKENIAFGVDNYSGIKIRNKDNVTVLYQKEDNILEIEKVCSIPEEDFNQMLSTFKFLN